MSIADFPPGVLQALFFEKITISIDSSLHSAMTVMEMASQYELPVGFCIVIDQDQRLAGVITDGDAREALLKGHGVTTPVTEVMTKNPVVVLENVPVGDVLKNVKSQVLESGRKRTIKQAILVNEVRQVLGIIDIDKLALSQLSNWENVAIIGLGYVGLTLAVTLAEVGYNVVCWDANSEIRNNLRKAVSHVYEVGLESLLKEQLHKSRLEIATSYEQLNKCSTFIIAVSTPVADTEPDVSYIQGAVDDLTGVLKQGDLVIIRSTVPVGTCRNLVAATIERKTNFIVGKEVGLAFAPERTVEGKAMEELRTLPQIIGGISEWSTEATARVFSKMSPAIVRVDGLEFAELIKLLNNTFRDVSFAFSNEVAKVCENFNLDAAKVIKAANSGYPRNMIALPSPGVGGPCLVKDPYIYMRANNDKMISSLAEVGRKINEQVPVRLAKRLIDSFKEVGKEPSSCVVYILGLAFKGEPETTDMRNSPTLDLIDALRGKVGAIYGFDAVVPQTMAEDHGVIWREIEEGFSGADAVMILNNHHSFNSLPIYELMEKMNRPALLFDGWGFFDSESIEGTSGIRYMGLSYLTPLSNIGKLIS